MYDGGDFGDAFRFPGLAGAETEFDEGIGWLFDGGGGEVWEEEEEGEG